MRSLACASIAVGFVFASCEATEVRFAMEIEVAEFSPDGRRILTVDGTPGAVAAVVLDAQTARPLLRIAGRTTAQFSPDGKRILTMCGPPIEIWDAGNGAPVCRLGNFQRYHERDEIDWSPDGKRIVTGTGFILGSYTAGASLWDSGSGKWIFEVAREHFVRAAFSTDATRVLTVGRGCIPVPVERPVRVTIWDGANGRPVLELPVRDEDRMKRGCMGLFSPDGSNVLFVADGVLSLFDSGDGTEEARKETSGENVFACYSPDGRRFLTCEYIYQPQRTSTCFARLWDAENVRQVARIPLGTAWNKGREYAAFSPDGKWFVANGLRKIWSAEDGSELARLDHPVFVRSPAPFGVRNDRLFVLREPKVLVIRDIRELVAGERRRAAGGNASPAYQ